MRFTVISSRVTWILMLIKWVIKALYMYSVNKFYSIEMKFG